MLVLLSGPIGAGKTTLCLRLVDAVRERGLAVSGVLTPAVVEKDVKVGIQAVDLSTGEVRLMARYAPDDDRWAAKRRPQGTRVGPYAFDDLTLDWAVALCSRALADDHAGQEGALVFVDEIGKLELNRGEGLAPLIPLLAEPREARVIVVVREALLSLLLSRVAKAEPRVVMVDPQCRHKAWNEITSLALGEATGL